MILVQWKQTCGEMYIAHVDDSIHSDDCVPQLYNYDVLLY